MKIADLEVALASIVSPSLAKDLITYFVDLRRDVSLSALEKTASGKFVETFVQCLQYMATGKFDSQPAVDSYLDKHVSSDLPEGLRTCAARIARAIYTLRNKRNVAHKNSIDPNTVDLAFAHQGAAWIMAELLRTSSSITMEQAGDLIRQVTAPIHALVEDFDGSKIVLADVPLRSEVLILLHSHYPEYAHIDVIRNAIFSTKDSLRMTLSRLRTSKMVFADQKRGYILTRRGVEEAEQQIMNLKQADR
jgi:hypothetical protein